MNSILKYHPKNPQQIRNPSSPSLSSLSSLSLVHSFIYLLPFLFLSKPIFFLFSVPIIVLPTAANQNSIHRPEQKPSSGKATIFLTGWIFFLPSSASSFPSLFPFRPSCSPIIGRQTTTALPHGFPFFFFHWPLAITALSLFFSVFLFQRGHRYPLH